MRKSVRYTLYGLKKSINDSYKSVVVSVQNPRILSGNEIGAHDWWRPAGRTFPGDIPEGVMEDISTKRGEPTWNIVN